MKTEVDPNDPVRKTGSKITVLILLGIAVGFYVASFFLLSGK